MMMSNTIKTLWFTGLSGAGKTTIAHLLKKRLDMHVSTIILDGDSMRPIISNDLGFSDSDRAENIRRSALLANHLNEQGVFVIAAFITPLESHRCLAKHVLEDHYLEVFIDAPLSVCEQRDVKGLYKLARSGKLINFTGISSRFEPPQNPWLTIDTQQTPDVCINRILTALKVEATPEHSHSPD